MKRYDVIWAWSRNHDDDLQVLVNEALKRGASLVGGIAVIPDGEYEFGIAQAVVYDEPDPMPADYEAGGTAGKPL